MKSVNMLNNIAFINNNLYKEVDITHWQLTLDLLQLFTIFKMIKQIYQKIKMYICFVFNLTEN